MKGVNAIQNFKMKQLRLSESSRNRKDSDSRDFRECRAKKNYKGPVPEMGSIK